MAQIYFYTTAQLINLYGINWIREEADLDLVNDVGGLSIEISDSFVPTIEERGCVHHGGYLIDRDYYKITLDISKENRLFSDKLEKALAGCTLGDTLLSHKMVKREKGDIKNINIISDNGGLLSYCPVGKEGLVSENGNYLKKNRQNSRIGRLIIKLCKEFDIHYNDSELETLVNRLKAYVSPFKFKILKGGDIPFHYHVDRHSSRSGGTLENSCMRHDKCRDFFNIYVENPEVCSMLALLDSEGLVVGRALLWVTDKGLFMDRVYGSDSVITKFENWAKENGYFYKEYHSADCKKGFIVDGETKLMTVSVTLTKSEFKYYPYLDTFSFMYNDNTIKNCDELDGLLGYLEKTDGSMTKIFKCYETKEIHDINYAVDVELSNGEIVKVHRDYTYRCAITDEYVVMEDSINVISKGICHKKVLLNNENNLIKLEDGSFDFSYNVYKCAYDGKKRSKLGDGSWNTSDYKTITVDGVVIEIYSNNIYKYLLENNLSEKSEFKNLFKEHSPVDDNSIKLKIQKLKRKSILDELGAFSYDSNF